MSAERRGMTIAQFYARKIREESHRLGTQFDAADAEPILAELIEDVFKRTRNAAAEIASDFSEFPNSVEVAIYRMTLPEILDRLL